MDLGHSVRDQVSAEPITFNGPCDDLIAEDNYFEIREGLQMDGVFDTWAMVKEDLGAVVIWE